MTQASGSDSEDKSVEVACSGPGEDTTATAIAGGASVSGSTGNQVAIVESRPVGLSGEVPSGWLAKAVEVRDNTGNWTLTVYAVCANVN